MLAECRAAGEHAVITTGRWKTLEWVMILIFNNILINGSTCRELPVCHFPFKLHECHYCFHLVYGNFNHFNLFLVLSWLEGIDCAVLKIVFFYRGSHFSKGDIFEGIKETSTRTHAFHILDGFYQLLNTLLPASHVKFMHILNTTAF